MLSNTKRRMTEAECQAEIDFFTAQLQQLDDTGSNDIVVDYLDKLEKNTKRQKKLLRARLERCLDVNRKFTDFQMQAVADQLKYDTAAVKDEEMAKAQLCIEALDRKLQRKRSRLSFTPRAAATTADAATASSSSSSSSVSAAAAAATVAGSFSPPSSPSSSSSSSSASSYSSSLSPPSSSSSSSGGGGGGGGDSSIGSTSSSATSSAATSSSSSSSGGAGGSAGAAADAGVDVGAGAPAADSPVARLREKMGLFAPLPSETIHEDLFMIALQGAQSAAKFYKQCGVSAAERRFEMILDTKKFRFGNQNFTVGDHVCVSSPDMAVDYCGRLKRFNRVEVIIEHDNRVDEFGHRAPSGTGRPVETRVTVRQLCEGRIFIFQNK